MKYKIMSKSLRKLRPLLRDEYFNELSNLVEKEFSNKDELLKKLKEILDIKSFGVHSSELIKEFETGIIYSIFSIYPRHILYILICAGLLLFFALVAITSKSFHPIFDYSETGQIGDTISGITAPFIGVIAALLTFFAFYMQYKANETHNRQFKEQSVEKERESVENKILYLIKQNRSIVENMSIQGINGDRCFSKMFNEYRTTHEIVESFYEGVITQEKDLINISFLLFYNGVGEVSNILNYSVLSDVPKLPLLFEAFDNVATEYRDVTQLEISKHTHSIEFDADPVLKLGYKPFVGHQTRLGQYYRNLFHVLSYTQSIDGDLMTKDDKYILIKSLRSQLSSYEQILIYFNSLSLYGKPLVDDGLINQFSLIKNIPLPLVYFAGDIHQHFTEILFEWDEIVDRSEKLHA